MSTVLDKNPAPQSESFTELLRQLATSSATVVQDEIELLKQEAKEKVRSILSGMVMAVIGIVLSLVALLSFSAALIFYLIPYLGVINAALATGGLFAVGGFIFILVGYSKLNSNA
ncbi:phage holin family protein [Fundidesulfovibrio putealis]|uniref:phage holin family protein n=1 Tax=Fundidesulfovibrio putealis TaxID=270496 RepID=UPI0004812642|nr:phage holin family protein [Fundidesulfovibrio putealis]